MIITGDIRRNLRIYSPPLELAASLKQLLTFNNPDYDSVVRHSPYGAEYTTIPKTVCLAVQYPKYLELPRGYPYSKLLTGKAKLLFDKITWRDLRVTAPLECPPVCRTKLNEDQELLVKKFLDARKNNLRPYGTYTFVAPTSGGKTLAAACIAVATGQKTLVLCKTNLIRRAWEEDLTKHFGIARNTIGRIQTTREDIGEHFTLGSLATLNRREDKWDYLLGQFGCVIVDECFVGSTLVGDRRIDSILPGDHVPSYDHTTRCVVYRRVLAVRRSPARVLCLVKLSNGRTITCTPNHPFFSEGRYVSACDLRKGCILLEHDAKSILNISKGSSLFSVRASHSDCSKASSLLLPRLLPQGNDLLFAGLRSKIEERKVAQGAKRRQSYAQSSYRSEASCDYAETQASPEGARGQWEVDTSLGREDAGCSWGPVGIRTSDQDGSGETIECPSLLQSGYSFSGEENSHRNRRAESFFSEGETSRHEENCHTSEVRVESITVLTQTATRELQGMFGSREVFNLHVEDTNNYFADGVLVHNCHIVGAETISRIVANCPAKYIIGMTATDHRKDGKTFVVHACLGRPLVRIQNKQEETSSSFPLGAVDIIRTDYEWLSPEGKVIEEPDFFGVCNDMRRDKARNALIISKVVEDWKKGNSVLVVSHRVSHCKLLRKKLAEAGVDDVNILTGETNAKKQYSEALVQSVLSGSVRCLVASKEVVKLGANLNPLNVLHCALPIGSASDLEQLVGRIRRKWKGKTGCRLVWYHDVKVPYLNSKYKRVLIPVLRKLKVPGWANVYVA